MSKVALTVVALVMVVCFVGCATLPFESKLQKPVSMTKMTNSSGAYFSQTEKAFWLFWGLTPLSLPEVDQVVGSAVADHAGVQNLKITTETDVVDFIVSALTYGIIQMRTVTIEGEAYD